jgi:hypothetical protein
MKTKTTGLTLALCFFGAALCFADDPQMGTWKLNEAKSKFAPGVPKNHTVVYDALFMAQSIESSSVRSRPVKGVKSVP